MSQVIASLACVALGISVTACLVSWGVSSDAAMVATLFGFWMGAEIVGTT